MSPEKNKRGGIFLAQKKTVPKWDLFMLLATYQAPMWAVSQGNLSLNDTNYARSRMNSEFSVRAQEKVPGPFQPTQ